MNRLCRALLVAVTCFAAPCLASDMEITPYRTANRSPLVQIFGLPAESSATIVPAGHIFLSLTQDVASNYAFSAAPREVVLLDGESYRWTLAARTGIGERFEAGVEIPYIMNSSGFMDSFIIDWHKAFGLPQGGRDTDVKGRLLYGYYKDGVPLLKMDHAGSGIGDIAFTAGMRLYDVHDTARHDSLALRTSIKVPTGASGSLQGSGSTDAALALCGSMNNFTENGSLGLFGSVGGMVMSRGDVLPDQQNRNAIFGTAGIGWGPAGWISFKFQLNAHSPLYHGSALDELSRNSLMLISGGAIMLPGNYLLDIGVSEDVAVTTAPDVTFHLGLSRQF